MKITKVVLLGVLGVSLSFIGCTKEKVAETPKEESVTKMLVPEKIEAKGKSFTLAMDNLKVDLTVNQGTQEMVGTPSLRGNFKIANTSNDLLKVQGVTIEYLDKAGKVIPFQSGDKMANPSLTLNDLKPGETSEASLDVSFPRAAVKGLSTMNVNVVYIPSPYKRETLALPETVK